MKKSLVLVLVIVMVMVAMIGCANNGTTADQVGSEETVSEKNRSFGRRHNWRRCGSDRGGRGWHAQYWIDYQE